MFSLVSGSHSFKLLLRDINLTIAPVYSCESQNMCIFLSENVKYSLLVHCIRISLFCIRKNTLPYFSLTEHCKYFRLSFAWGDTRDIQGLHRTHLDCMEAEKGY